MTCLKCFKKDSNTIEHDLPDMLSHLANYTICSACDDSLERARQRYKSRSGYYKKIQQRYRDNLNHQYINRLLADNSDLLPSDIPEELTDAKRQHLKMKKLIKEEYGE